MTNRIMAPRNGASRTLSRESDGVARRVTGPWVRSTSATTQHITMADKVETNNPQGLINEGNPTLHEMAQNTNPTMQMLDGILQTQIRLLQGIA